MGAWTRAYTRCLERIRSWLIAIALSAVAMAASADQNATELGPLFEKLANASSASEASQIENKIWQHWLIAPDDNSAALMSQIISAMKARRINIAIVLSDQLIDSAPNFAETRAAPHRSYFRFRADIFAAWQLSKRPGSF